MRILWVIYRSDLRNRNPLMLKEIHHGGLMMSFFSFQFYLKLSRHVLLLSNTWYVVYTVWLMWKLYQIKLLMQFQHKTSFLHHFFFHVNLSCRWTKTLIGCFEALILSFEILFSILSALISSAKSEYDGRDTFSSFIQYEGSGDAKGVAD